MKWADLATTKEVAKLKGVCDRTVRHAIMRGWLPATRIGRIWLVTWENANAWHPKRGRRPRRPAGMHERCAWEFASRECGYKPGKGARFHECGKTLEDCIARGKDLARRGLPAVLPGRFSGLPGMPGKEAKTHRQSGTKRHAR